MYMANLVIFQSGITRNVLIITRVPSQSVFMLLALHVCGKLGEFQAGMTLNVLTITRVASQSVLVILTLYI